MWTQADLDKLKAAVLALASGEAVQTVSYDGPPSRTITYQPMDLPKMRALLAEIVAEVSASTRSSVRRAAFRKGF